MERFFEEVFRGELEWIQRESHPSFQTLMGFVVGELDEGLLSRISVHAATCRQCSNEIRSIREELGVLDEVLPEILILRKEEEREKAVGKIKRLEVVASVTSWLKAFKIKNLLTRPAFYAHLGAYATATAILLALNIIQDPIPPEPGLAAVGEKIWWFQWPVLLWGILVAWHGIKAFIRK